MRNVSALGFVSFIASLTRETSRAALGVTISVCLSAKIEVGEWGLLPVTSGNPE